MRSPLTLEEVTRWGAAWAQVARKAGVKRLVVGWDPRSSSGPMSEAFILGVGLNLKVLVLGMAYRYLFVLLDSVTEMVTARRARTVAAKRSRRGERAIASFSGGALFGKAHALSEEVHQAMLARGFSGELRMSEWPRIRAIDVISVLTCLALAILVVGGDRALGL